MEYDPHLVELSYAGRLARSAWTEWVEFWEAVKGKMHFSRALLAHLPDWQAMISAIPATTSSVIQRKTSSPV